MGQVKIDNTRCIGCGACVAIAPDTFDFNDEAFSAAARMRNPNISIIPISALTEEGFDTWINWLENRMKEWKAQE